MIKALSVDFSNQKLSVQARTGTLAIDFSKLSDENKKLILKPNKGVFK
jgi:hypothetical protein